MRPYGPTGITRRISSSIPDEQRCNRMSSYDFSMIGIFVVACILIYLGYTSLNETTMNLMGKDIVTITKELLVENSIYELPSNIINIVTERVSEQSIELFSATKNEIRSNVLATCSTNAGIVSTLFSTNTYTSCVSSQTTTELARIAAMQTYYLTTTLTKTLSGVSYGLNLLYIGLGLFGSSSGYIAVRLGIKKIPRMITSNSRSRVITVDGGNKNHTKHSKKSKKSKKSNKSNKSRKSKGTKKYRKH
jgi:hypothetical protein